MFLVRCLSGSPACRRTDWSWTVVVKGLLVLARNVDCQAQNAALENMLRQLDVWMRNSCEALAEQKVDSLQFNQIGSGSRKRRADEDFKKDVVETFQKERKTTNIGAGVKVWCGLTTQSTARTWADRYVIERNLASRRHIAVNRVLGVTEDASKNGNPKEETNVYVVFDAHARESTFGALQVLVGPMGFWSSGFFLHGSFHSMVSPNMLMSTCF